MGRKKKYIEMFGSFTEPFSCLSCSWCTWLEMLKWISSN